MKDKLGFKEVKNTYDNDCIFLLKDLSDDIEEITIEEKEELIRKGRSYSEFISKENSPSKEIKTIFNEMVEKYKKELAFYIAKVSELILKDKGDNIVLVSLARGGTPYGILVRKYIKYKFNLDIPHYSVSIIRGKGLDLNALKYILKLHKDSKIQFIDGWTGKGSITREISKSIESFNYENCTSIDSNMAVISDPAKLCKICGTREDFGIPTSCLNATVSGLISRTIHNEKYIGSKEFHGAKYLDYLEEHDVSQEFIDKVVDEFISINVSEEELTYEAIYDNYSMDITYKIQEIYHVKSINNIKLSVGETARVLLRRVPRVILVKDKKSKDIQHIIQLAKERSVDVIENEIIKNSSYNCISIIKEK